MLYPVAQRLRLSILEAVQYLAQDHVRVRKEPANMIGTTVRRWAVYVHPGHQCTIAAVQAITAAGAVDCLDCGVFERIEFHAAADHFIVRRPV